MKLDPQVQSLLEERRLADGGAGRRRGFTLSKTAALLRWREQGGPHWAVHLARAANVLSDRAAGMARESNGGMEIEIIHPGFSLEDVDLGDVLLHALAPDRGVSLRDPTRADRVARWRESLARALNRALADDPQLIEVMTPSGGRRYERRDAAGAGSDPYALRVTGRSEGQERFFVRLAWRTDLGTRFRSWFSDDPVDAVREAWRQAVVGAGEIGGERDEPFSLAALLPGVPVMLGDHARFGRAPEQRGPWLIRDGVRILDLRPALVGAGLGTPPMGWVECPSLRLSADDRSVVRDASFDLLVAWLHDMEAHTYAGAGPTPSVIWPTDVASVRTVSGREEGTDALLHRARARTGEVLFTAPHAASAVQGRAREHVYAIWPSELRVLTERLSELRFVPVAALGTSGELRRIDLTPLREGCLPPLDLGRDLVVEVGGRELVADLEAHIHRYPGATLGSVVVLVFDRPIVQARDHTRVIAGVTAVLRLSPSSLTGGIGELQDDEEATERLVTYVHDRLRDSEEALCGRVFETAGVPLENPYLRTRLAELDARSIRLRYELNGGVARLAWESHPLLSLVLGRDAADRTLTLADALARLRDVGFLVLGDARRRYRALESSDPDLSTVFFAPETAAWIGGVLDPESIDRMPTAPEAYPRVRPAADQATLVAGGPMREDLDAVATSAAARVRLLGRALIARSLGKPNAALEGLRIIARYDPRALRPSSHVSLTDARRESPPPGLVPPGTVGRDLPGPALVVSPPIAALMHEVLGLQPARSPTSSDPSVGDRAEPRRRRAAPREALLVRRVDHELALGSLQISGDGRSDGITIWSRGLRVGSLDLPEPLGRITGRLWLTAKGRLARADRLGGVVRGLAVDMLLDAPRQRTLLPPSDRRRASLGALMEYVAQVVGRDGDVFGLRDALGEQAEVGFEAGLDASLRRYPIRRSSTLDSLVRSCLARRVPIERAILSWTPGKLTEERHVEIGNRNAWVRRAEDGPMPALAATLMVLDGVLRDDRWWKELAHDPAKRRERRAWVMRTIWRWMAHLAELE